VHEGYFSSSSLQNSDSDGSSPHSSPRLERLNTRKSLKTQGVLEKVDRYLRGDRSSQTNISQPLPNQKYYTDDEGTFILFTNY
jgi:hypothetical protein